LKQSTKNLIKRKRAGRRNYLVKFYTIGGIATAIAILTIVLSRPDGQTYNFTIPPVESTSEADTKNITNVFSLNIAAPLIDINRSSNQLKIKQVKGIDDGPRECSKDKEGKLNCYTTKYHYTISTGSPTITPGSDKTINISIPAYISGRGIHKGRGHDKSQSDIRYFQSKLIANANIKVTLDSKWCPRIKIQPDFLWKDKTRVEVFHKAKVDIQYRAEKKLHDAVTRAGKVAMKDFISCDAIRAQLYKSWRHVSFPINKPDSQEQQYINIKPDSLGYIGLKLISDKLFMEFKLTASTQIADTPIDHSERELPPSFQTSSENNIAYIPVPVSLGYHEILTKIQRQIGSEPFFTENRFGEHTIQINKMKLYPSDGKLVIGLHLQITNSEDYLDKSGWVYIITRPELMNTSNGIFLSQAQYSNGSDDDEWVTIRRALKESILQTIEERGLVVNFSESSRHLLRAMKSELKKPRTNTPVLFTNPEFEINNISLLPGELVVNGVLGADASFVTDTVFKTIATNDITDSNSGTPIDPAIEKIQLQMDSLLHQIDVIEKKLGQFRKILNN